MLSVEEETSKNFIFAPRRAKAFALTQKCMKELKFHHFF